MNYGIGNVKAKSSGGGGIPQITIEATQFTDATHIQFTQDQYNTIVNNGCVNIDIAGSGTLLFTMQNNSINANVYLYSVSDNYTASTNAIEFATIELNKTTYVGTLNQNSYEKSSGGKQLYWQQYQCFQVYSDASHPGFSFVFQIYTSNGELNINSLDKLRNFLKDNGLTNTAPRLEVLYGELTQDDGTTWRKIEGVHVNSAGNLLYVTCPKYAGVGSGARISRDEIQLPNLAISRMFSIKL